MARFLITGASRGLGEMLQLKLPQKLDTVYLVSRSKPKQPRDGIKRHWIQADLAQQGVVKVVIETLGDVTLDVLIYNAGIWEENAFSEDYNFEALSEEEMRQVIDVNLNSAIMVVQKLLPNLRKSLNPKIILIGSVTKPTREVPK